MRGEQRRRHVAVRDRSALRPSRHRPENFGLRAICATAAMGYGSELFLAPIDENLKCGVCLDVLKEPKSVCQEGHTFCADCIKSVTRSDSDFRFRCPICRGKPLEPPFATNRIVQNMVGALALRCPHHETTSTEEPPSQRQCTQLRRSRRGRADEDADTANAQPRGCAWEGTCDDLAAHLRSCPFEAVPCKLGCGARLTPDQLDAHRDTCPRREVSCELCDKRLPFHELEVHAKNECPEVMASCRFCGKEMLRKELGRGVPVSPMFYIIIPTTTRTSVTIIGSARRSMSSALFTSRASNSRSRCALAVANTSAKTRRRIIRPPRTSTPRPSACTSRRRTLRALSRTPQQHGRYLAKGSGSDRVATSYDGPRTRSKRPNLPPGRLQWWVGGGGGTR